MQLLQKNNKVHFRVVAFLIILAAFSVFIWVSQPATFSHLVMKVASSSAETQGVAAHSGLKIQFESPESAKELNWFSGMCLYNEMGLTEKDLGLKGSKPFDLSIYYTFGDFKNGRSLIYDVDSEYHNAFYGAYLVKGLGDISASHDALKAVAKFDYTQLILRGLGYSEPNIPFETVTTSTESKVTYCGFRDWTRWDATIQTLSVNHRVTSNLPHYIQFGKPNQSEQTPEFEATQIYGRMYARYFKETEVCVIYYILTPDSRLLEQTDEQLLSGTRINQQREVQP